MIHGYWQQAQTRIRELFEESLKFYIAGFVYGILFFTVYLCYFTILFYGAAVCDPEYGANLLFDRSKK